MRVLGVATTIVTILDTNIGVLKEVSARAISKQSENVAGQFGHLFA